MGKSEEKHVVISGFNIHDNNRGTAALSYGAVSFLIRKGFLREGQEIVKFTYMKKFWNKKFSKKNPDCIKAEGKEWLVNYVNVFWGEELLAYKFGILLPFTSFGKIMRKCKYVASINGGDGFADIYGTRLFLMRLHDALVALGLRKKHIILPQTIGPFREKKNENIANRIIKSSYKVYVRDDKYVKNLNNLSVDYEETQDLSAFMMPQKWECLLREECVGINVSGLCYANRFNGLEGQFDEYPNLINSIIELFQNKGKNIYLIPHSYNYQSPEINNDDLVACRKVYDSLHDKHNVMLVDRDLTSPQVKYLISQMSFFIGTRMHANFAAIYTKVPLFGLAYSYKFEGAFNSSGLDAEKQTAYINNIKNEDIINIVKKIDSYYQSIGTNSINKH